METSDCYVNNAIPSSGGENIYEIVNRDQPAKNESSDCTTGRSLKKLRSAFVVIFPILAILAIGVGYPILIKMMLEIQQEMNTLQQGLSAVQLQLKNFTIENNKLAVEERLDCSDVARNGYTTNGAYNISVNGNRTEVYCDFEKWLVFQKRYSGAVDFYRNWSDYKIGFGDKSGEFWLGLETLHQITNSRSYRLRIDLEDWKGNTAYAEYSSFTIGNESSHFSINLGQFNGTAGDSLSQHNNQPFTAKDRDNSGSNCAVRFHGAWWYDSCHLSNLNGEYVKGSLSRDERGMIWRSWKGMFYSMKKTVMKIRLV